jgi:hypothetical protein
MANTYFVVFNDQIEGATEELNRKAGKEGKTLAAVKTARFVKMEAESVKDAQEAVATLFPGNASGTPIVVTEAAWKTS